MLIVVRNEGFPMVKARDDALLRGASTGSGATMRGTQRGTSYVLSRNGAKHGGDSVPPESPTRSLPFFS